MTTMIAGTEPSTDDLPEPRILHFYQREAVEAVERDWFADNDIRRVGVVLPTGAGKSTVVGKLGSNAFHRGQRVLCLAHRDMLIKQMRRDMIAVDPTLAPFTGIVMADHNDLEARIVFATLQTLKSKKRRKALEAHGEFDVIIWDEVHHAGAVGWHATFSDLGGYHPRAFMCGVTATMHRSDERGGQQIGLGDVMQKISYERDLRWAIDQGYLVEPHGLTVRIPELDALNDIRTVAGDFHQGELAEAMEAAVGFVVDAVIQHASDRRSIIFAASVGAAWEMAAQLRERGVAAEATTGELAYDDREPIYDRFRSGETQHLVTVQVLTEGADFPMCDATIMARPTKSKNLYTQMIGRCLRLFTHPETGAVKDDALVLDLAGSTRSMKLVNLTKLDRGFGIREAKEDGEIVDLTEEELDELAEEPGERPARVKREGVVDMVEIDLFGDTRGDVLWLQTPAGVPFIPVGDHHNPHLKNKAVFLWPRGGVKGAEDWAVGVVDTSTRKGEFFDVEPNPDYDPTDPDSDDVVPIHMDIEQAINSAHTHVRVTLGGSLPDKDAPWRTSNQKPSEGQAHFGRALGIVGYDGMTKGKLSDEISIAMVSRVLDKWMEPVQ